MDRTEFKNKAKASIDDIFAKIDEMEAKKNSISEDLKHEYEETLFSLRLKKAELQLKYDEMLNAKEEKWEEVKTVFSSASESFKEGFSRLATLFH